MSLKRLFCFLSAVLFGTLFSACDKPGLYPGGSLKDAPIECLVLNEGLLNTNAGALSVVYRDSTVVVDAFQDVNHRPMGDVAQSVTLINGKYFVAMNNSKKVEILDPVTFRSLGTIIIQAGGLSAADCAGVPYGSRRVGFAQSAGEDTYRRAVWRAPGIYFRSGMD